MYMYVCVYMYTNVCVYLHREAMYVHACMLLTHTRANVCLHYRMSIGDHKVAMQRTWLCTL